jgi:hypothetical protein
MNNKMKIKIQKRKKKREGEEGRGREMEHDAEWVYEATMGAETIRAEPLQHGKKTKKTRTFIFCTPFFSMPSKNILIHLPLFFSFHRLLLAHRGKRNGFCHYIDIMTIYTSIRKWWRYSYLSTYGPALFFFIPRIHFHLFISLAESLYTPPCRPFSLSFSLSFSLFKKWLVQRVYRPVRVMSAKSTSDRA